MEARLRGTSPVGMSSAVICRNSRQVAWSSSLIVFATYALPARALIDRLGGLKEEMKAIDKRVRARDVFSGVRHFALPPLPHGVPRP